MTDAIRDNYDIVKRQRATFADGTLPSWLSDASSGGGSINVVPDHGGRVTLSCGTSATGDEGKIEADRISAGDFDGIFLSAIFQHGPNAATEGVCDTAIGMEDSSGDDRVVHFINSAGFANNFNFGGGGDKYGTRRGINPNLMETEMLFDVVDGVGIHRYQNSLAKQVTDTSPDPADTFYPNAKIIQRDTSADRELHINEFEVAYVKKANR